MPDQLREWFPVGVDDVALPAGPVEEVARALLGWELTGGGVTVRLTEVEGYAGVGEDPASHAHRGRTPRNAVMFGPPGHAYVYFVYGMHWCLNVVTGPEGRAQAVLLRAGEVLSGADAARARRKSPVRDRDLARGPARLTTALGVDAAANGTNLLDGTGPLLLTPPPTPVPPALIAAGPRVGVAGGEDTPWRYWLADAPSVSPYRARRR
ncbi:DNA-3-methyladenine glycosylase [Longispora urticae]